MESNKNTSIFDFLLSIKIKEPEARAITSTLSDHSYETLQDLIEDPLESADQLVTLGVPLRWANRIFKNQLALISKKKSISDQTTVWHFPADMCTIEKDDETSIYWFQGKPSRITPSLFLDCIPAYIDFNGNLSTLVDFFSKQTEANAASFFLPPGIGKTTIARFAAAAAKCLYVRMSVSREILYKIFNKMRTHCSTMNSVVAEYLSLQLHVISLTGIDRIFQLIKKQILSDGEKYSIIQLVGNDYSCDLADNEQDLLKQIDTAEKNAQNSLNEIFAIIGNTTLVLHFDELQRCLNENNEKFIRKRGKDIIRKEDIPNYYLVCFSEVIQRSLSGKIKYLFSGTVLRLSQQLRLSSDLKQYQSIITPDDLPLKVVKKLIYMFCQLDDEELCNKLSGPGRVTQNFIKVFLEKSKDLSQCVEAAMKNTFSIVSEESNILQVPPNIWDRLIILFTNVEKCSGKVQQEGYWFPSSVISKKPWTTWASSGLFKAKESNNNNNKGLLFPFPSYPYRWFARHSSKSFSEIDSQVLFSTRVSSQYCQAMMKGYTFSTALGLELLVPTSGIYVLLGKVGFLPMERKEKSLVYCYNEAEFSKLENNWIGVAVDDISKGVKYGDIAFCVEKKGLFPGNNPIIKCRIEAKNYQSDQNSELLDLAIAFFESKKVQKEVHLAIFVCSSQFMPWIYEEGNVTAKKKQLIRFLEDKDAFMLIDNVLNMKDTILDFKKILNIQKTTEMKSIPLSTSQDFPPPKNEKTEGLEGLDDSDEREIDVCC